MALTPDADIGRVYETVGAFDVADVNGDGLRDLILATGPVSAATSPPPGGVYVIPGTRTRPSGEIALDDEHLLIAGVDQDGRGIVQGSFGPSLDAGGDVTGDGIADILTTLQTESDGQRSTLAVLLPSGLDPSSIEP